MCWFRKVILWEWEMVCDKKYLHQLRTGQKMAMFTLLSTFWIASILRFLLLFPISEIGIFCLKQWWGLVTIQKNKIHFCEIILIHFEFFYYRFLITIEWIWKSHLVSFIYLMLWHFLTCVLNVLVVALAGIRYLYVFKVRWTKDIWNTLYFNRPSLHQTNKSKNGKITDFGETWVGWPTHRWGWPHKIFLSWGHPNRRESTPYFWTY